MKWMACIAQVTTYWIIEMDRFFVTLLLMLVAMLLRLPAMLPVQVMQINDNLLSRKPVDPKRNVSISTFIMVMGY